MTIGADPYPSHVSLVRKYGEILMCVIDQEFAHENLLPAPKAALRDALLVCLGRTSDVKDHETLINAYLALSKFQPYVFALDIRVAKQMKTIGGEKNPETLQAFAKDLAQSRTPI